MMHQMRGISSKRSWHLRLLGVCVSLSLGLLTACGALSSNVASGGPKVAPSYANDAQPDPSMASLQLRVGDDSMSPDDPIVVFRLDIRSVILSDSTNTFPRVDVITEPVSVELAHTSTTTFPVSRVNLPPGASYDTLTMVYSGLGVTFIKWDQSLIDTELGIPPQQVIPLSPTVKSGAAGAATILNLKVNVPATLQSAAKQAKGNSKPRHTPTPGAAPKMGNSVSLTVSQNGVGNPQEQQSENGGLENVVGTVTSRSGNSITVTRNGSNYTFQADGKTMFEGISIDEIAAGQMLELNGATLPDGSFYAEEVEFIDPTNGSQLHALVAGYLPSGNLAGTMQNAVGQGTDSITVGQTVTALVDNGVDYKVNSVEFDLTGFNLIFDGNHIFPGQQVEFESRSPVVADPILAEGNPALMYVNSVELEQQTVWGTASGFVLGTPGTGTFLLTLSPTIAPALLNQGTITMEVYLQSKTFPAITTLEDGTPLQARGLLVCATSNSNEQPCGDFYMVASKITVLPNN